MELKERDTGSQREKDIVSEKEREQEVKERERETGS